MIKKTIETTMVNIKLIYRGIVICNLYLKTLMLFDSTIHILTNGLSIVR